MKKLLRKTGITAFVMFLVAGLLMPVRAEGKDFDTFLEDEWREMMESSYIDMHFAVKDPEAIAVRYGMKNWSEASLFNSFGIPASPFRSDEWE